MKCHRKNKCDPCRCEAEGEWLKADALALLKARRECYVLPTNEPGATAATAAPGTEVQTP